MYRGRGKGGALGKHQVYWTLCMVQPLKAPPYGRVKISQKILDLQTLFFLGEIAICKSTGTINVALRPWG